MLVVILNTHTHTHSPRSPQGTLCDVTLVVQGKHFPAHRVVLAAASPFFSLMFTSRSCTQEQHTMFLFFFSCNIYLSSLLHPTARMKESMSPEVELRNAEPEIIELLIEFIYTARLGNLP